MFAKTIVLSDAFLNMPMSARCLYFTLGMLADDDGFVNAPRSIMRQCGASDDDMKILILKKFAIEFDTGVIVIKHWRINNYLRSDRYTETKYTAEKKCLSVDESGNYHVIESPGIPIIGIPPGIPPGIPSIGKDSIDKDSVDNQYIAQKSAEESPVEKMFSAFWEAYGNKKGKKNAFKAFSKINPTEELFKSIMDGVEKYHQSRKWREGYRKEPATWLNGECWNDEYNEESGVNGNSEHSGNTGKNSNGPRTTYSIRPRFAGHVYDADGNDVTPGT